MNKDQKQLEEIEPVYAFEPEPGDEDNPRIPALVDEMDIEIPALYIVDARELRLMSSLGPQFYCRGVRTWATQELPQGVCKLPQTAMFKFERNRVRTISLQNPSAVYARPFLHFAKKCWKAYGSVKNFHDELPRFNVEFKETGYQVDDVTWLGINLWAEWNNTGLQMGERISFLADHFPQHSNLRNEIGSETFGRRFQRLGLTPEL